MIRITFDQQFAEVENYSVLLPLQLILNPSDSPNTPRPQSSTPTLRPTPQFFTSPTFFLPSIPLHNPPFPPNHPIKPTLTLTLPALIPSHRMYVDTISYIPYPHPIFPYLVLFYSKARWYGRV